MTIRSFESLMSRDWKCFKEAEVFTASKMPMWELFFCLGKSLVWGKHRLIIHLSADVETGSCSGRVHQMLHFQRTFT